MIARRSAIAASPIGAPSSSRGEPRQPAKANRPNKLFIEETELQRAQKALTTWKAAAFVMAFVIVQISPTHGGRGIPSVNFTIGGFVALGGRSGYRMKLFVAEPITPRSRVSCHEVFTRLCAPVKLFRSVPRRRSGFPPTLRQFRKPVASSLVPKSAVHGAPASWSHAGR